jgi:sec-independent protein translocase protein TatC
MPLDQTEEGKEMSFIDHLEELRWNVLRAVASILIFTIAAFIFIDEIFDLVILAPAHHDFWTYRMMCRLSPALCINDDVTLQSTEMAGLFTTALVSSVIIGLVFAFPYAFWEIWRFIKPGLKPSERRASRGAVFYVTFLFLLGVTFGYFIVSPLAVQFLANFKLAGIKQNINIGSFVNLVVVTTMACGLTFQLPIVAFVLSKIGILTPKFMREYRRHAFVVILIVAAVLTPSPDLLSQLLVSLPLTILYELSIIVSARVEKAKKLEETESESTSE